MKLYKRITALIMTLSLAVSGLPAGSFALAAENATPSELPDTRMRFIETNFDNSTGILTMSLQIKPDVRDGYNDTIGEGVFVFQTDAQKVVPITNPAAGSYKERKELLPFPGTAYMVADSGSTGSPYIKEYLKSGKIRQAYADESNPVDPEGHEVSFSMAMNTGERFLGKSTGFFVGREVGSNKLNCYFQYRVNLSGTDKYMGWRYDNATGQYVKDDSPTSPWTEDGYLNVMNFDFRCYSGYDENGMPKVASSHEALFEGAVEIPEDQAAVQRILSIFNYEDAGGNTVNMTMGGAGFVQRYEDGMSLRTNYKAYYYYDKPQTNPWRKGSDLTGTEDWSAVAVPTDDAPAADGSVKPGLWYNNMLLRYILEGLTAVLNNTVEGDEEFVPAPTPEDPDAGTWRPVANPDFKMPVDSSGNHVEVGVRCPRYSIPTAAASKQRDKDVAEGLQTNWVPEAYQGGGARPALKYYFRSGVSEGSLTTPEIEDLDSFMANLKWEFLFKDDLSSLEDCAVTEAEGEGKLIPTVGGNYYRVKEAAITDAKYQGTQLEGAKVWNVYRRVKEENGSAEEVYTDVYFMRCPVGVTLDMMATSVTTNEEKTAIAPQLHVTNEAADPQSYIWKNIAGGWLYLRPTYDPQGGAFKDVPMEIRLYKESDLVPDHAGVEPKGMSSVTTAGNETATGFWVGNSKLDGSGVETANLDSKLDGSGQEVPRDAMAEGIPVTSFVYDQYGMHYTIKDSKHYTLTFAPSGAADPQNSPFEVVAGREAGSYTIKYKSGKNVNDVKEGYYTLKGSYKAPWEPEFEETVTLYVKKTPNRLAYMEVDIPEAHDTLSETVVTETAEDGRTIEGTVIKASFKVPEYDTNGYPVTQTLHMNISSLSNQWLKTAGYVDDPGEYDIVPGIRAVAEDGTVSATVGLALARSKGVTVTFDKSYPAAGSAPAGLNDADIYSTGQISFTSDLKDYKDEDGNLLPQAVYRMTATYPNGAHVPAEEKHSYFVEYQICFVREPGYLKNIVLKDGAGNRRTSFDMLVPLPGKDPAKQEINIEFQDQYGTYWGPDDVVEAYRPGGNRNPITDPVNKPNGNWDNYPDYGIYLYTPEGEDETVLPDGVTLDGLHRNVITVQPGIESASFQVYAGLAGVTTKENPVTINIMRERSKANTVQNLRYNNGTALASPALGAGENVYEPYLEVIDQYEKTLTYNTDPTKTEYTVTGSIVSFVSISGKDSRTYTAEELENARSLVTVGDNGAIHVKPGAPDCVIRMKVTADTGASKKSITTDVTVARAGIIATSIAVDQGETESNWIKQPSTDDIKKDPSKAIMSLTATGVTQYGEGQTFEKTKLTWTLESVEYAAGGGTLTRVNQVLDPTSGQMVDVPTGDINYNTSQGKYTTKDNRVTLTQYGDLSFISALKESELPEAVTVTVTFGSARCTQRVVIHREPDEPTLLLFPDKDAYDKGVQVPISTVTVPLEVIVRSQYGVEMPDEEVTWTVEEIVSDGNGITADLANKQVIISNDAVEGDYISLKASCAGVADDADLIISVYQGEELYVDEVKVTALKDSSGTVHYPASYSGGTIPEFTVDLPAKTGAGYDTFTMMKVVINQFSKPFGSTVQWTAESVTAGVDLGNIVSVENENAGSYEIRFQEDARNVLLAGNTVSLTLQATATSDNTKYGQALVHFRLAESEPAYAEPTFPGCAVDEWGDPQIEVPHRDVGSAEAIVEAKVYDQYGVWMPKETADITLTELGRVGLKFEQILKQPGTDSADAISRGVLTVNSTVTQPLETRVRATPDGKPIDSDYSRTQRVSMKKDTVTPDKLQMDADNIYEFDIPYWEKRPQADAPIEGDQVETMTLRAEVVDAYGSWLSTLSGTIHPVWEFAEEYPGVSFSAASDPNADGVAEGEDVTLEITNRAIPKGQTEYTVTLKLKTTNRPEDEYFATTAQVKLKRLPPKETYLYIDGVDFSGVAKEKLNRPEAAAGFTDYQFSPVVYDRYGIVMDAATAAVDYDLDVDAVDTKMGAVEVEKIFKAGEKEEDGDRPVGYKIYRVEYEDPEDEKTAKKTLMAWFNREDSTENGVERKKGQLTVYTELNVELLSQLSLVATCDALSVGGTKTMLLPLGEEPLRPTTVKINRSCGDFIIKPGDEDGDPIKDYIYPTVYDQYGQVYTGKYRVQWALVLPEKTEDGRDVLYSSTPEYDEEGFERAPSQYLVLLNAASNNISATVTVQPKSFYEEKTVVLRTIVIDQDDTRSRPLVDDILVYTDLNVREYRNPGAAGITATFDAGEFGKLVGPPTVTVGYGEAVSEPPGVKTVEGYGFMGWTADGETIVDARKISLFSDTLYTAVYRDVTSTKFLEGRGDGKVYPDDVVTRAEFVSMVVRAIGGFDETADYGSSFPDVHAGRWYSKTIAFAKRKGIISGYADNLFRPDKPITRAEAARILADAAQLKSETTGTFSDVEPGSWYEKYVEALFEAGVISGVGDGTYRPFRQLTRGEAVKMIIMITKNAPNELELDNIRENAYCPFTDIRRGHWAYAYIIRGAGIA